MYSIVSSICYFIIPSSSIIIVVTLKLQYTFLFYSNILKLLPLPLPKQHKKCRDYLHFSVLMSFVLLSHVLLLLMLCVAEDFIVLNSQHPFILTLYLLWYTLFLSALSCFHLGSSSFSKKNSHNVSCSVSLLLMRFPVSLCLKICLFCFHFFRNIFPRIAS